ncbi:MAG: hypothetical protein IGS48_22160 [Oscillatoriales cyanobacterium C42_A2020_001]|nr:hypothetical protein [Leptolyngbyaceae cyanobacterium C42_A2020_001]
MNNHTHSMSCSLNLILTSAAIASVITGFNPKAFAATFKVSNNNDSGTGSLRQAIIDAGKSSGLDIIDLTGLSGTIPLNSPLIVDAGNDIKFEGNGTITISGQRICQIMAINGAKVDISGITFVDGFAQGGEGRNGGGGGLGAGGALFVNAGVVKLNNNVKFIGNGASGGISVVESNFYNGGDYYEGGRDGGRGGKLNAGTCGGITFAANSSFPPIGADGNGGRGGPSVNRKGAKGDDGQEGGFGTGGGGGGGGGSKRNLLFAKSDRAGHGGKGGKGGYGAGGGSGGGGGRSYWNSGNPGSNGEAGAYAGSGQWGGIGWDGRGVGCGGGGAALGGAIFVRSGATLIRSFDTVFRDNYVAGGRSSDAFGRACNSGQGAGPDIFLQDGEGTSELTLAIRNSSE